MCDTDRGWLAGHSHTLIKIVFVSLTVYSPTDTHSPHQAYSMPLGCGKWVWEVARGDGCACLHP